MCQKSTDIFFAMKNLHKGKTVVFPTETVYGLGADVTNELAIKKVFNIKHRPFTHPLILHIADPSQLKDWAINISEQALTLANTYWPGPLTLVLEKHPRVSDLATGGQKTVALRIPKHPLTLAMLKEFGSAIVGPSANSYGKISPTNPQHVLSDLGDQIDFILDGGQCELGIESTIINCTNDNFQILRNGSITSKQLETILDKKITLNTSSTIKVPGLDKVHYSPNKALFLLTSKELLSIKNPEEYSFFSWTSPKESINWLQANYDPIQYAKHLYSNLHTLDFDSSKAIIVEKPPTTIEWFAIIDRLTRASSSFDE